MITGFGSDAVLSNEKTDALIAASDPCEDLLTSYLHEEVVRLV